MRTKRASVLATAALTGALLMGGSISIASASTPSGGTVHVIDYGDGAGAGGTVVLTGAIGDFGESVTIDSNGTIDPQNGSEVNLSLTQGSFRLNVSGLDKKLNSLFGSFRPNSSTCSGNLSTSSTIPIVTGSGTGSYKGISGKFNLTITFAEIGPKITSGKHKGQCNESNSAPSLGSAMIVTGSGTVSL